MTDGTIDEVAVAGALRRLDAVIAAHPELVGPTGPDNVSDWIDILEIDDKGPPTMPTEPTEQVAFRLSKRLIARLDAHAERMGQGQSDLTYSRTDAVRDSLGRALDEVEGDKRTKRGKP